MYGVVGCGVRVGGNGGNPKKAESHLRRSESTQGAPGVQGGLFGVQEGAVGSQEVAGKWRCMNDFSQKVEDFSRFFEIGSFRPWRRRRWSRLAERSPKPVFPLKTDHGKWVSLKTRKIRRFPRCQVHVPSKILASDPPRLKLLVLFGVWCFGALL